ncbi:MAG: SSS family solute:Na+ symporter [Verrucomicrobiales bacterium]|jgi:SSS family solute:Na+ symporter
MRAREAFYRFDQIMHSADWIVLSAYLAGTVLLGILLGRMVKNSSDFFSAGGKSPWWTSGLSAFMTMFSANTFVVWGGVAFKHGLVAVMINLMYGIAALLVGRFVAGRWKEIGVRTPAEFVERRFGGAALHFYTWMLMTLRVVGSAGALYAIARLMVAATGGNQSADKWLGIAIVTFGVIIVVYTMMGGLWAVLMTDVLQFIILNLSVIFVVVLTLMQIGDPGPIFQNAPEGFFSLTSGPKYTWFFLIGWLAIHYFMIGAEWAFVQRSLCVPTAKDARKANYLFGVLYLVSPFLWLAPPLLWRLRNPIPEGASEAEITALAENAYILSCQSVLPVGMVGLMMAAMFSATASLVSTQLNVFSSVLTNDIYGRLRPGLDDRQLVRAGRVFTVLLGIVISGIALGIPFLGGAERVVIAVTELMVVPLLAPCLWGLFNRKVPTRALWWTVGLCFPLGLAFRFAMPAGDAGLIGWLNANSKLVETFIGVVLPLLVTAATVALARRESPGWARVEALDKDTGEQDPKSSRVPALVVGWCMAACSLMMFVLTLVNEQSRGALLAFAAALGVVSAVTLKLSGQKPNEFSE